MFISHHLEELDGEYWQQQLGNAQPAPDAVLAILELRSNWLADDDSGLDQFDFTLPGDVTDYVVSVGFDEDGNVADISMES